MELVFYIAGAVAVISTALMLTRLNVVHALLYLIVSFLGIAVVFFVLGAPFVAALEVIVYAGAIMVLFVFVGMMLNLGQHVRRDRESSGLRLGFGLGRCFWQAFCLSRLCICWRAAPRIRAPSLSDQRKWGWLCSVLT